MAVPFRTYQTQKILCKVQLSGLGAWKLLGEGEEQTCLDFVRIESLRSKTFKLSQGANTEWHHLLVSCRSPWSGGWNQWKSVHFATKLIYCLTELRVKTGSYIKIIIWVTNSAVKELEPMPFHVWLPPDYHPNIEILAVGINLVLRALNQDTLN